MWKNILEFLERDNSVGLILVIENKGSSPGRRGFKMMVSEDGALEGSIGGGLMEFNMVEIARKYLKDSSAEPFVKLQVHNADVKDSSGLVCSGEQTMLFYKLNISNIKVIKSIIDAYSQNIKGTLRLTSCKFEFLPIIQESIGFKDTLPDWEYTEILNNRDTVYIIGGGHVGYACSRLLKYLGFYIVMIDNRADLKMFNENDYPDSKIVMSYDDVSQCVTEDKDNFVIVMTTKFVEDKKVVSALIKKQYKYLGVLGSKNKMKKMFDELENEGFSKNELERVYTPIGLNIKSETTEEIAISIAAQIIMIKNSK